ncbi:HisA/HisF-related TIM barrel protein [Oharaeibacter diazotrophicus]|uniref:Phosphoribosylformimino-5-aminoimidazole carboxamide ribotide isomerase n=2 Tax=Oharaeibacter diazotrophicus TaxID=1920512 RepID=A0A4R6RJL0_9HYPH|nr:HisA/HisF-related TIM barrel protein [Oharaeibacter diazotrophicus]TDP86602.1 phosphoribosylformimino-5-aminoimidazole carboxamide ribotide isomerase [Oharaeibacter diazotrophicus]BBE71457.1 nickel transporter [Pleomorphomonas sp. SM30]GLS78217.1 nickel transporter [Oharaeibacter diazotrophicus]
MRIVPVIDLMDGHVVRARHGDRASYRPIETPLARGSAPEDVAAGLLALHPFRTLYVADLDGILRGARADAVIDRLVARFPDVVFWVDNGLADGAALAAWADAHGARPIVGTESQTSAAALVAAGPAAVLSIDFKGEAYAGPEEILADAGCWPDDVVVMTLGRVGGRAGPDFARLAAIAGRAGPGRRVHAAGGVRGADDLAALAEAGIAGALVATALHDGTLDTAALARFADGR